MPTADTFRPLTWTEYIGQAPLKLELEIAVTAACQRNEPFKPVLLAGRPGFGKTSLAAIMANEMGKELRSLVCPFDERTLLREAMNFDGVLFLDEIHRLTGKQQETLLTLLEDGYVAARGGRRYDVSNVSIVAATTERHRLLGTIIDRFPILPTFDSYTDEEMGKIVEGMVARTQLTFTPEDCVALGRAAAGTPRDAKSLVLSGVDLLDALGRQPTVQDILDLKRIEPDGLTLEHCRYMEMLFRQDGLASAKVMQTIMHTPAAHTAAIEELLIERNYITIGARGRELTPHGYAWLDRRASAQ